MNMKPLIIANWKCNPVSLEEARNLLDSLNKEINDLNGAEVVVCPPSVFLSALVEEGQIVFGAQNCFSEDKGAFTGEISIRMIENIGCKYVILGHSERRNIFKETNEEINKKVLKVIDSKVIPILCIGENGAEREKGRTFDVLEEQLSKCLEGVPEEKAGSIVLAYEPVWAIGTGKFADTEKIKEVRTFLKEFISKRYNKKTGDDLKIIYGGSVDSNNVYSYLSEASMDGVLVGGASLKPDEFLKLIKSAGAECECK